MEEAMYRIEWRKKKQDGTQLREIDRSFLFKILLKDYTRHAILPSLKAMELRVQKAFYLHVQHRCIAAQSLMVLGSFSSLFLVPANIIVAIYSFI